MSDRTPTTETVRGQYTREQPPLIATVGEKRAEFDRWLEQVKAEAWEEGYDEPRECCGICPSGACPWDNNKKGPTNPYRKEQDQ